MTEKECERKAALTKEAYERLLLLFGKLAPPVAYRQENFYYDTPDFYLAKNHATLRIREAGGHLLRQYKHGQVKKGDLRIATEDNAPVSALPEKISGATLPDCPPDLVFLPLGSLVTYRTDFRIGQALLSLDKSEYLGVTDYELELETGENDGIPEAILSAGVDFSRPVMGKFHRFLLQLGKK